MFIAKIDKLLFSLFVDTLLTFERVRILQLHTRAREGINTAQFRAAFEFMFM